jgi:hypothetical protein
VLYCQFQNLRHRVPATSALTFLRDDATPAVARVLACSEHAAQAAGETVERFGLPDTFTLSLVEDVFEEHIVVSMTRDSLARTALSPVMLAYDRACRTAHDRGLAPVTTYRLPVQWRETGSRMAGTEVVEAHVTLAVTRRRTAALATVGA